MSWLMAREMVDFLLMKSNVWSSLSALGSVMVAGLGRNLFLYGLDPAPPLRIVHKQQINSTN